MVASYYILLCINCSIETINIFFVCKFVKFLYNNRKGRVEVEVGRPIDPPLTWAFQLEHVIVRFDTTVAM